MTTQSQTMHNPTGNAKALKFTAADGVTPPYYVPIGWLNDIPLNDAGGNYLTMTFVDSSVVPTGGGPGNPRPPV
jgi:hypothetical protein